MYWCIRFVLCFPTDSARNADICAGGSKRAYMEVLYSGNYDIGGRRIDALLFYRLLIFYMPVLGRAFINRAAIQGCRTVYDIHDIVRGIVHSCFSRYG